MSLSAFQERGFWTLQECVKRISFWRRQEEAASEYAITADARRSGW
jgi:hypothetical protein